jgi:[acyl-carrier-protein] S-malonyltransferase
MQADLAAEFDVVAATYEEASSVLGFDLWDLVQSGPAEKLGETTNTQPAMLAAGVAAYRVWLASGGDAPTQVAGHSLGEYTALVCAGAVEFADAMRVVKRRSELMQAAVPAGEGGMAAIIGLDDDVVQEICAEAASAGVVEAVNFNSPGQVVIAGHTGAVEAAAAIATDKGAMKAIVLPVSVPSHSSLMTSAGEALAESLAAADFKTPAIQVIGAADARPYSDGDDIRNRLSSQVYSPVRWVETIQALTEGGATRIVECGPGKVLTGLMRRIDRKMSTGFIHDQASLQKALAG